MTTKADSIRVKLAGSRAELLALAQAMTDEDWNRQAFSEGSEWRMVDILRHIADSERGMTNLIIQVQGGGQGVPPDFDLHRWNQRAVAKLQEKSVAELLADMEASRGVLLATIDGLEDADWGKQGRHASLQIMTTEEVCHLIADHEQAHVEGMKSALGQ